MRFSRVVVDGGCFDSVSAPSSSSLTGQAEIWWSSLWTFGCLRNSLLQTQEAADLLFQIFGFECLKTM